MSLKEKEEVLHTVIPQCTVSAYAQDGHLVTRSNTVLWFSPIRYHTRTNENNVINSNTSPLLFTK